MSSSLNSIRQIGRLALALAAVAALSTCIPVGQAANKTRATPAS
jgi:hypothetical protein